MTIKVVLPELQPGWLGGRSYLSTIRDGVRHLEENGLVEVLNTPRLNLGENPSRRKYGIENAAAYGFDTLRGMRALNIPRPLGVFSKKSLAWIPDLQDVERPEFFSSQEIERREKIRRQHLSRKHAFFFSSDYSLKIFQSLGYVNPRVAGILRFVATFEEQALGEKHGNHCAGCEEYGFFYLPNQWWIHKNHRWALESFAEYQSSGGRAHLVLTGEEKDPRWPKYSAEMVFSKVDLKNVHRLGLVSRAHQRELYLNAIAVIQPSSYEGWSTTIEEALFFGTPIIASNLPTNSEQIIDCKDAKIVEANSILSLVEALVEPPKKLDKSELHVRKSMRWNRFINDLETIVVNAHTLTQ